LAQPLAEKHLARIVEAEVDRMERTQLTFLKTLEGAYRGSGSDAYHPRLMLRIVLYEILEGRRSPAQWHRDIPVSKALLWLGRGIQPSRTACYTFRDRMETIIQSVHKGLMKQALSDGLLNGETGVLDGTSVRACASRHRVVNIKTLTQRLEQIKVACELDQQLQPPDVIPNWMARTPTGRIEQQKRFARAMTVLQLRLAANSRKQKDKRLPEHRVYVSTSDPEAPLGRDKEKVFCPLYSPQFVIDSESRLVMAWDVFAQATDSGTLGPMIDATKNIVGHRFKRISADAGYCSLLDLQTCESRSVELFAPFQENSLTEQKRKANPPKQIPRSRFTWIATENSYRCPRGQLLKHTGRERRSRRNSEFVIEHRFQCLPEICQSCPLAAQCLRPGSSSRTIKRLEGQEILEAHQAKMVTSEAKAIHRLRGSLVERSFGDAKEHRQFRRFHGRGVARVKAETGLVILAQNLLTLHRLRNFANATVETS
jgi:transposase